MRNSSLIIAMVALTVSCSQRDRQYSDRQPGEETSNNHGVVMAEDNVAVGEEVAEQNVTEIQIVEDPAIEVRTAEETNSITPDIAARVEDTGTEDVVGVTRSDVVIEPAQPAENEMIFTAVEQMPTFPGGDSEMMKFIASNINYPTIAAENEVQGTVLLQFAVMKDGSIGEIKVVRSRDRDLDREAIRVVRSFPRFNPGLHNGEPVNCWFTIPIRFKLQ